MAKIEVASFDTRAAIVPGAIERMDATASECADIIRVSYQTFIDEAGAGLPKDESHTKALGKAMREAQPFLDAVALGALERKTVTEYAQSAMRAFFYGVPFEQSLKNNPDMALPWGGAKGGAKGGDKAGGVKPPTREDLDATLCKALAQARMLGLTEFAANILDLCLESLDNFSEPTAR